MKLCLTIGVSQAAPLTALPGAIVAANEMGEWAQRAGFITRVITDEHQVPVTISRIREALLAMLPRNDEVELFILHFAGHGLRAGAEQHIWLPGDWSEELRGISVDALKNRLLRYGIKNLSVFSDACRSQPDEVEKADIFGDPVLPKGPFSRVEPVIDRFNAAGDGGLAYMLNGDEQAPPRCVFSTVMLEGLWGLDDAAFDRYLPDSVIPESLDLFSRQRLRQIGEQYDLHCTPANQTGNPRDHAIYYQRSDRVDPRPVLHWPQPGRPLPAGRLRDAELQASLTPFNTRAFRQHIEESLYLQACGGMRDLNLVICGGEPVRVWSCSDVEFHQKLQDKQFCRVSAKGQGAIQLLIEYADAVYASAVVYRGLTTVISRNKNGQVSWSCFSDMDPGDNKLRPAAALIAKLQTGTLTAAEVDSVAAAMRSDKHINPVLGVIASYLYDYTADIDNIRRIAWFYALTGQAMPYDVALLGGLPLVGERGNDLRVTVPAVNARQSAAASERLSLSATRATDQREGTVAGCWPWLRQGWDHLQNPDSGEQAETEWAAEVARSLLPSQFSCFREAGAARLIETFHLEASK